MSKDQENLGEYIQVMSEKISLIEERIARNLSVGPMPDDVSMVEPFGTGFRTTGGHVDDKRNGLLNRTREPLPDKRLVQRLMDLRSLRKAFFEEDIFGEPAWDMLLDLVVARIECRRVSITSLCVASGVAPTTALRWIARLSEVGLVDREADDRDARRTFISLSDAGARSIAECFARWQELKKV